MHVDHLKHDGEEDEEHETSDDAASQPGDQTEEVEGDGPEEPSEDAAEGTAIEDAPSENGQSDSQEDAGDENDDAQSSEKTSPDPKDKGTAKSYYKDTNLNGESKPDISGEISKQRDHGDDKPVGDKGTKEDPKVLEYADEGEQKGFKKVTYADAKGGFKKRIEAPGGRKQGEPKPEDDKGIDPVGSLCLGRTALALTK